MLTACATIGPPQPPSLELPKPPADLRATRKGDRVLLDLDGSRASRPIGRLCGVWVRPRSAGDLRVEVAAVWNSGGEGRLPASRSPPSTSKASANPKVAGSYTDSLPGQTAERRSFRLHYLCGRSAQCGWPRRWAFESGAGFVWRALFRRPMDFSARVTGQGVVLTWTSVSPPCGSTQPVHYVYRVYRRPEGSPRADRLPARFRREANAVSLSPIRTSSGKRPTNIMRRRSR